VELHTIHADLLRRRVRVLAVGCGGTGSVIAAGLPYLAPDPAREWHPAGLQVTLMDGDAGLEQAAAPNTVSAQELQRKRARNLAQVPECESED
jgi:hypothetical protein